RVAEARDRVREHHGLVGADGRHGDDVAGVVGSLPGHVERGPACHLVRRLQAGAHGAGGEGRAAPDDPGAALREDQVVARLPVAGSAGETVSSTSNSGASSNANSFASPSATASPANVSGASANVSGASANASATTAE